MIIIYHSRDLDGYTSGAILKKKFPQATLIGYDYGAPVPAGLQGEDIIMVDVSFDMATMMTVAEESKSFVWIDHHISAIKEFNKYEILPVKFVAVVLRDGVAACELAWDWAFPDKEMPYAVKLLGMYDTWRNDDKDMWQYEIMPFQYGMRTLCQSPETFPDFLFDIDYHDTQIAEIVLIGKTILEYQESQDARAAKGAFLFKWMGYRVIAINGGGFNSNAFKSVYRPEDHDIMMPFKYDGSVMLWICSLYTDKDIDVSVLAKSMGGGGHKKAAGFQVEEVKHLPFQLR